MIKYFAIAFLSMLSTVALAEPDKNTQPEVKKAPITVAYNKLKESPFVFDEKKETKYEIIYFFSYGCPHCYQFEPYFEAWQKRFKQEDTAIHYVPVSFQEGWEELAKGFIIANQLGLKDFTPEIFTAIHKDRYKITTMSELREFFLQTYNVDSTTFNNAYNSLDSTMTLEKYNQLTDNFGVEGTPSIVVITHEKKAFITSPGRAGNFINTLFSIDYIISQNRKK